MASVPGSLNKEPFRAAIKWLHRFTTLALLIMVIGFAWLNHQPNPRASDELLRTYQISNSVWLYMTVNNQGGATVPTIYRYYLSQPLQGKNADIVQELATKSPVLEGTGSISEARINDKGEVAITYNGNVFSLHENVSDLRFTIKP